MLVEADGARQRPVKMPGPGEPVVPDDSNLVVTVVGLDALGREIGPDSVHRPELLRAFAGADVITTEVIVRLLTDDAAGLKGVPASSACAALLTRIGPDSEEEARHIAERLLSRRPGRIGRAVLANLRRQEYVAVRPSCS
jgi:probable selenium-dependent hydroxylase accessory protein YqeC